MVFQNTFQKGFKLKTLMTRLLSTKTILPKAIFLQRLESRTVLKISGKEVEDYLQGLITNDIKHLHVGSPCVYAMFLNSRGRVLYDSIIYKTKEPETFLIECDLSAAEPLRKHLMIYRVRRKITVDPEENFRLWVISTNVDTEEKNNMKCMAEKLQNSLNNCLVCVDPRITSLGLRILAPKEANVTDLVEKVKDFEVVTDDNSYKSLRYKLGVGEGIEELPPGNCLPMEANCDYLNGVSFHKGCYIGQELTARTYHTGVIRKRLMPIHFDEKMNCSDKDVPIYASDSSEKSIGKLRGIQGNLGIGLLRIEEALRAPDLRILGKICRTNRPYWWQNDKMDEEESEPKLEEKCFECYICKLKQKYEIKGKSLPSVKQITLKEDSYLMENPFSKRGKKNILILGSDCAICKNPICQSPDCSIYFKNRYCHKCASANKNIFPMQLHQKIKTSV